MCLGIAGAICPTHRDMGVVGVPLFEEPFEDCEDDEQPDDAIPEVSESEWERRWAG